MPQRWSQKGSLVYDLSVYDEAFFAANQAEGLAMAEWFMPLLVGIFGFQSLMDVGCGRGHYIKWAVDHGINAEGTDGGIWPFKKPVLTDRIVWSDLRTKDLNVFPTRPGYWDLALCIEVAEHIEPEYADNLIDLLTNLSNTIVFTAAPPGQGGLQHVNEQPQSYWINKFQRRGFYHNSAMTLDLRYGIGAAINAGHHVAAWMLPNIMCFMKAKDGGAAGMITV